MLPQSHLLELAGCKVCDTAIKSVWYEISSLVRISIALDVENESPTLGVGVPTQ